MAVGDIKQIKPDENEKAKETSDKKEEKSSSDEESILIPKIEPKDKKEKDENESSEKPEKKESRFSNIFNFLKGENGEKKWLKITAIVAGVFLLLALLIGIPSFLVYKKAVAFSQAAQNLVSVGKAQNLDAVKEELDNTKKAHKELKSTYRYISWTRFIPFFGGYTRDGQHAINAAGYGLEAGEILLTTAEPYADILGFTGQDVLGEATGGGEKTTQERIDFIVSTLPDLIPKIDEISGKVSLANAEVKQINPGRYPRNLAGRPVREKVVTAIDLVDTADKFVRNGKPLLEQAPYLLGLNDERRYLVLFQNDKELRPTGGFLTAYSIMSVEKAKFEPVSSNDIYNLDATYTPVIEAPDPIVNYLEGPYVLDQDIRLRDMNWSPDFRESMELFMKEAEKVGIEDVDGVIAVDTHLLVNLLEVLGPIGVPGFGNFSTEIVAECNCPQVIYELESFADVEGPIVWDPVSGEIVYSPPNTDNRKRIIGPLMNSILANALGQPKEKVPDLFKAGFKSLLEKHVLFYLFDEDAQNAVESFGIAGRIKDYEGDYLHINDSNLGGRKSNLYVTQEIEQNIEVSRDGSVVKTVTITYKNPEPHDGWLNSVLPNWVRIYVPKGSELVDFSGVEDRKEPYEEFGKTVYAGFFELRPQGVAKVTVQYKLPFKVDSNYNLLIQKQPGKDNPLYVINIGKQREEFFLKVDEEKKFRI